MSSELNADLKTPRQRTADNGVRLNPLPAKNALLTVVFFSAVAAAILLLDLFPSGYLDTVRKFRGASRKPCRDRRGIPASTAGLARIVWKRQIDVEALAAASA